MNGESHMTALLSKIKMQTINSIINYFFMLFITSKKSVNTSHLCQRVVELPVVAETNSTLLVCVLAADANLKFKHCMS